MRRAGLCCCRMRKTVLTLISACLLANSSVAVPAAQHMYRWTDTNGVVHYSDRPAPGAQRMDTPSIPKSSPDTPANKKPRVASSSPSVTLPAAPAARERGGCEITEPAQGQVFVSATSVVIAFRGPPETSAALLLNGTRSDAAVNSTSIAVSPIARGTYSATVIFNSPGGQALCQTAAVTFYVRQPSILRPAGRT